MRSSKNCWATEGLVNAMIILARAQNSEGEEVVTFDISWRPSGVVPLFQGDEGVWL